MSLSDSAYLHGLNLCPQFGPARLQLLANHFASFKDAYEAPYKKFTQLKLDEKIIQDFLKLRELTNLANEISRLENEQINILTFKDKSYPKLLLEIPKFPPLLYYKGTMENPDELCAAIVGTRKISNYGRIVTPNIVEPLVNAGVTIVSGMAFGVDAAAHQIAINNNRRTIAVLGGGLDEKSLYPKHHALMAKQIIQTGGAIISEYPIGTPNYKQNFVARNRIISGLSLATVVVECDLKSGTLITARHALDQNRQVYAVPGPIYSPQSMGPNNLLKMGAKPITEASDILEDLNLKTLPQQTENQKLLGDSKEETILLKLISYEPIIINDIIKISGLDAGSVISTLTFLEMKGKIRNLGGQQYVTSR
jgi:DNA processing protein